MNFPVWIVRHLENGLETSHFDKQEDQQKSAKVAQMNEKNLFDVHSYNSQLG